MEWDWLNIRYVFCKIQADPKKFVWLEPVGGKINKSNVTLYITWLGFAGYSLFFHRVQTRECYAAV